MGKASRALVRPAPALSQCCPSIIFKSSAIKQVELGCFQTASDSLSRRLFIYLPKYCVHHPLSVSHTIVSLLIFLSFPALQCCIPWTEPTKAAFTAMLPNPTMTGEPWAVSKASDAAEDIRDFAMGIETFVLSSLLLCSFFWAL